MISKLKILSLLLVAHIFSTPLFAASLRQRVQSQLTTSPTQQFWSKMAQQRAKFTHAGQVTWSKIRLHPATPIAQKVITGHTTHYFSNPARLANLPSKVKPQQTETASKEKIKANILVSSTNTIPMTPKQLESLNIQPCTDPELLHLFNTIKRDMGITQNIPLFISNDSNAAIGGGFMSQIGTNNVYGIFINPKTANYDPILIIKNLAHELGHFLQFSHDPASYPEIARLPLYNNLSPKAKKLASFIGEVGAEANSAGYLDCQDCLHHVQERAHDTNSELHQLGYFDAIDWQPYIERAVEHNWLCPAHEHMRNQPITEKFKHILDEQKQSLQHLLGQYSKPKYPLSAYLPQTYDRSGYSAPETLD